MSLLGSLFGNLWGVSLELVNLFRDLRSVEEGQLPLPKRRNHISADARLIKLRWCHLEDVGALPLAHPLQLLGHHRVAAGLWLRVRTA